MPSKRSVFKSLEEKIQFARDSEPPSPPKTRPAIGHVKARWIRSSAMQVLERPFKGNLGNIKACTDGYAADNNLCYSPVGNQQTHANFGASLRQGMLRYYDGPNKHSATDTTAAFPPIPIPAYPEVPLIIIRDTSPPPTIPDATISELADMLPASALKQLAQHLRTEAGQGVLDVASSCTLSNPASPRQRTAGAGGLMEDALAKQMGVDVADVARLLGTEHTTTSISPGTALDTSRNTVESSPAAASSHQALHCSVSTVHAGQQQLQRDGSHAPSITRPRTAPVRSSNNQQAPVTGPRMSEPMLAPLNREGRSRHSFVSPTSLKFAHLGETRKTYGWLQEAREICWEMQKHEKQLLPVATANKCRQH